MRKNANVPATSGTSCPGLPVGQVPGLTAGVLDQRDRGECPDCAEPVGDQVEQAAGEAKGGGGDDADQDVTGVRDRGVGQQPLDVGLGDGDDRPDDHGEDGDGPHDRPPVPGQPAEGHVEDSQQGPERGHQRARGHQRGDRRRRALVDVGLPALERHRADLNSRPSSDQRHALLSSRVSLVVLLGDRGWRWPSSSHRAAKPVDQGDAEQEEGRGEGAQQEVLHGRFLPQQVVVVVGQAAQQIQRQRQRLQGHEHGQQVVGRPGNSSMPPTANRVSGYISACVDALEPGPFASFLGAARDRGRLGHERVRPCAGVW